MRRLFSTTAIFGNSALSLGAAPNSPKSQKFPNPTRWAKPPGMASNSHGRTTASGEPYDMFQFHRRPPPTPSRHVG